MENLDLSSKLSNVSMYSDLITKKVSSWSSPYDVYDEDLSWNFEAFKKVSFYLFTSIAILLTRLLFLFERALT